MTGIRKRSPTNKEFKTNFQGLASTKTKKGHLNNQQEKKPSDNAKENGILVRIHKNKLYENGWEVKVGTGNEAVTYMCSYGDAVLYIPESTLTGKYYVPKQKTEVEVTIDKKSKIYTITKINTLNKKPIALYENNLTISTNTNTDTNSNVTTSIEVSNDSVNIKSDNVTITDSNNNKIDLVATQTTTAQQIIDLKEQNQSLLERIEILENKVNTQENNTDTENNNINQEGE